MTAATRLYISPRYKGADKGDGGIRRVVEAQERWLPKYGFELTEHVRDCEIAAFHAGNWEDPPAGAVAIAHTHGLYWAEYNWEYKWFQDVNRQVIQTLQLADATSAPSMWVADALRRGMWLDPWVLYHGIEPEEWPERTSPGDGYILWNKTRVDPICDPLPVNELARRAKGEKFISTFGDETQNVHITGNMPYDRARALVRDAGVYLATSRETFGIGTLEAMAAGVPVLGFAFGGQPEVVVHKEHGYLAAPGDYEDLVRGLEYIRAHHAYMSHAARKHVLDEFTWEKMMWQYALMYNDALSRKRASVKVSVVITNYNLGQYLGEAVASAEEATAYLKDAGGAEVIVVDDASTEPLPPDIARNQNVKLVVNTTNRYLAEALNVGVGTARGEYILPLDADNLVDKDGLKVLVDALDSNRLLDIAYGKMSVFGSEAAPFVSGWPPPAADLEEQLKHKNQITSTALYRKKVWNRIGGYRRRCRTAEDADFWTRALALGFTGRQVTEAVTLHYRDRPDSMSRVQKDWPWNEWYGWASSTRLGRSWATGGAIHIHDVPLVSVVIPVGRGHERLVLDALDSVQAQSRSFWNWEVIVVNDTGKRLPWIHPWARVVNGQGKGVSHARNIGTHFVRSDYLLYLDADDFLHPDALYHMYYTAVTTTCPSVFVYTDYFTVEDGKRRYVEDFERSDVLGKLPFPVSCLYKKSDLVKNGVRWDESFKSGWEDWDYAIQVVASGICGVRVPAPLLHYRLKTGTLRETALANSEEIKLKVRDKWALTDLGVDKMPGCGGCGGGRYPSLLGGSADRNVGVFDGIDIEAETSMLQYNPPPEWTGTRSFLGRVTGNRYRFSPDGDGRIRRVYNRDIDGLVELGFFNVVEDSVGEVAPLMAAGPPERDAT